MDELPTITQTTDILRRFSDHKPIPELNQMSRYKENRRKGGELALHFARECPESPELSMAFMYLDHAVLLANAAIARNEKIKE